MFVVGVDAGVVREVRKVRNGGGCGSRCGCGCGVDELGGAPGVSGAPATGGSGALGGLRPAGDVGTTESVGTLARPGTLTRPGALVRPGALADVPGARRTRDVVGAGGPTGLGVLAALRALRKGVRKAAGTRPGRRGGRNGRGGRPRRNGPVRVGEPELARILLRFALGPRDRPPAGTGRVRRPVGPLRGLVVLRRPVVRRLRRLRGRRPLGQCVGRQRLVSGRRAGGAVVRTGARVPALVTG
ncbi:hypothetical protein ACWGKD_15440, partial [Streptomyces decoyicus]